VLVNGSTLLGVANENNFAIPAFNIADYSMFVGLMDIAEEKRAPLILAIHPNEVGLMGWDVVQAIKARVINSSIPAIIHWDHGLTYEQIIHCIRNGFTSVMIDRSADSFEENVAVSKRVADTAHIVGVSVEGELGTIGATDIYAEGGTKDIIYTEPDEAARFIEATGVDSLAIAIGTRHGIYPSELQPELKLDLLKDIKAAVGIPLVLHGGSNNPDEEIAEAARTGVNKINISSDIKIAYFEKLREVLEDGKLREPDQIQPPAMEAMKKVAAHKLDLLGTTGKAELY
jgi:fructose-bisphosphate aldolase, class II